MYSKGDRVDLLDHGYVRLVDSMGSDLSVVRAARTSYDAPWRAGEDEGSDHKLIHYLMKNRHTTPFEAVELQFEVLAPIFVFRQWHRHRTQSYSELSARYRELPRMFYLPLPEHVGVQSSSNKQGRDLSVAGLLGVREYEIDDVRDHCEKAFDLYDKLIASEWPKELARMVLPLNVYSHMFAKMNLHNLFHFLGLRAHSHAQYEIRVYAEAMTEMARSVAPVSVAAWEKFHEPE